MSKGCWVVRGGDFNELIDRFRDEGVVAIGWSEVGDMTPYTTPEELRTAIERSYPNWSKPKVGASLSQLKQFRILMEPGDYVCTPVKATREVMIGKITGPFRYQPEGGKDRYLNNREVEWLKTVRREAFSKAAKGSLGALMTVYSLQPHLAEIESILEGKTPPSATGDDETPDPYTYDSIQSAMEERVAEHLDNVDPYDFQRLVGGLLIAMGYHAKVGPRGPDGGVDVSAFSDPLGVESPRIQVQVKRRKDAATGPEIRTLIGTLRGTDRGLFVSTGGFTKDAESEASRADRTVSLLNWDDFVALLYKHYDKLDPELKALVPMKRVWVLAVSDE